MSVNTATSASNATSNDFPAELSPQKKFLNHFRQYPLVNSGREAFFTIPFTRAIADSITPTLKSVRKTQPVKYVLDSGDLVAESMLTQLDNVFPSLISLEAHDLTDPITRPVNGSIQNAQEAMNAAHETVFKNVVEPTAKTLNDCRFRFNSTVYDANGKGIVSSLIDPVVAPVNESLERFVTVWFPETKKVSKDHSSEIARAFLIISNVLTHNHEENTITTEEQIPQTTETVEPKVEPKVEAAKK